jgi:predicted pyridoxine 5'-phosphate oxidase superfamily flavin-nucleotide-binding protein
MAESPYHRGSVSVQQRAGVSHIAERNGRGITDHLPEVAREFLASARLLVVGHDDDGGMWCSAVTGAPGFVANPDDHTVAIDFTRSNGLNAAVAVGRRVGLLALEPSTRRRMRVNGTTAAAPAGQMWIAVEQVFSNCPKYITSREIAPVVAARAASAHVTTGSTLTASQRRTIALADTAFVSTTAPASAGGSVDASHRGGEPGFLRIHDERHLSWDDLPGNAMFLTLGNLALDPRAGLLVIDWSTGASIELSGHAHTEWHGPGDREVHFEIDRVRETTFAERPQPNDADALRDRQRLVSRSTQ